MCLISFGECSASIWRVFLTPWRRVHAHMRGVLASWFGEWDFWRVDWYSYLWPAVKGQVHCVNVWPVKNRLTVSMCDILLKDRSSQASFRGSARKRLTLWRKLLRSAMWLLLRRRELHRYLLSLFFLNGRSPALGSCASETGEEEGELRKNPRQLCSV